MVCYRDCYIAAAFITATIFTSFSIDKCDANYRLKKLLNREQQQKLNEIVQERFRLFWAGTVLGAIIGYLMLQYIGDVEDFHRGCFFAMSVLVTQYLFYSLSPKKDLLVTHLTTKEQIDAWVDVYKEMQNRYHLGLATGVIGYYFIGSGLFTGT
jgi:hypothetical protein